MGNNISAWEELHESSSYRQGPVHKSSPPSPSTTKARVIQFHSSAKWKAHFEASIETDKLIVVDFTASWCGPCRFMDPVFDQFAAIYTDVEFIKIDADEVADVAAEYAVHAIPTYVLLKKGKMVDKVVGADKEGLKKKIEKHRA